MRLVHIKDEYIKFLRDYDNKITILKDQGRQRPYVGIVMSVGGFKYFAPFSSPKKDNNGNLLNDYVNKYKKNNKPTYEQIEGLKYGVILLNNMIPVSENQIIEFDIGKVDDDKYRMILQDQFIYCNDNKERIVKKANKLYNLVTKFKQQHFINISCNFKLLEQNCLEYIALQEQKEVQEQVALGDENETC